MAEYVDQVMQEMLPEMEEMERIGLLSSQNIKWVVPLVLVIMKTL